MATQITWLHLFWIALGGSVGALCRFGLQASLLAVLPNFPLGTAIANLTGAFLAGLVYVLLPTLHVSVKPLVAVGFVGALTTLSTFSLEVVLLLKEERYLAAVIHWLGGAFLALIAVVLGMAVGQLIEK